MTGATCFLASKTADLPISPAANHPIIAQTANVERTTVRSSQSRATPFISQIIDIPLWLLYRIGSLWPKRVGLRLRERVIWDRNTAGQEQELLKFGLAALGEF
jgi:hypothetical protein